MVSTSQKPPGLSKSRFQSGMQCHKRLFLESHHRDLLPEASAAQQAIFDTGHRVGELACKRFPGGVLFEEDFTQFKPALQRTNALLADASIPAFYEPAFLHENVKVRVDILKRNDDGSFDLIEVKSTTRTKDVHIRDLAIQYYVLQGSGITVNRACLMHLNTDYVYQGGEYDLEQLFAIDNMTEQVKALQDAIPGQLTAMKTMLAEDAPPMIETGDQCYSPYSCPFIDYCHDEPFEHPVTELPRLRTALLERFEIDGIAEINEVPDKYFAEDSLYERIRKCVRQNQPYYSSELKHAFKGLKYPIHFLDFETFNPALPLFPGTRPYQVLPFQWSNHTMRPGGALTHAEFLHNDATDPREAFVTSLIHTLGETGSIVVYSPYEQGVINRLAKEFPHYAQPLAALRGRIFDLLPIVREHCYHPDFHGSFSIKKVLPALVPELSYDALPIADGTAAANGFSEMIDSTTLPDRKEQLRTDLLAYCKLDTYAMVRLLGVLYPSSS